MLNPLLPRRVDNTYGGFAPAVWLLALLVLMKLAVALGCIFNGHTAASSADGIPIDTFGAAGARTVLAMFANWGVSQVVICALGVLVLLRYRALVPLMFTLLLLEQLGRKVVSVAMPIPRTGAPAGSMVNLVFLGLMIAGLALSLWSRKPLRNEE